MANSKLASKNLYYKVPQYIIDEISISLLKNKNIPSSVKQKAKNITKNKFLSYENLKRIKGIFDSANDIDVDLKAEERELQKQQKKNDLMFLGGNKMKNWVESQLGSLRNPIQRSKKAKSNFAGFKNEFRKSHSKSFVKAPEMPKVKNMVKDLKPRAIMESEDLSLNLPLKLNFACVCIIFNEENKLLLVKRSQEDDWMANKFALVGGRCEENEIPEQTIIRETKEETNLTLKKPKLVYSTIEGSTFLYVFISKVTNSDKIKLNDEHTGYIWVNSNDIKDYDTVPNLMEMVKKAHDILVANVEEQTQEEEF
jgi:8-oxo-dGTP pyrophosphatase MutT (NUDIX family)